METVKKAFRKEFIIPFILLVAFVIYILFFKPSPVVRVDWNKVQANKGSSVLAFDGPSEVDGVGKNFVIKVNVDTEGSLINAVQAHVEFDPRVLEIIKTNTEESFCKFYPENNYNNEKGLVKLSCGSPYPGFKGKNTVISIEFMAKAIKTTELKLTKDSMVLANDGKGTNLLKDLASMEIHVKAAL